MKKHLLLFVLISIILLSFKQSNEQMNPLLVEFDTPFNTVPFDKIEPSHFEPAFETLFEETTKKIELIKQIKTEDATFENTIVALENASYKIQYISLILGNLKAAETNPELQEVVRIMSPRLVEFANNITTDEQLFERIKYVKDNAGELDTEDKQLLDKTYKSFVRSGAELNEEEKEKLIEINKTLASLSVTFAENVLAETNNYYLHITNESDIKNLPDNALETAAQVAKSKGLEGWAFTLHYPSYVAFMKNTDNRELREKMYKAFSSVGYHDNEYNNEKNIKQIVNLRREKAQLLGYNSYADYVLEERMAKSIDNVYNLFEELREASFPYAEKELQEMKDFMKESGDSFDIKPWDWRYYAEKLKKKKFNIDDEITRPYFALENVQEGIFDLGNKLYGLTFKENKDIPKYHPDVHAFEVYDSDGSFLSVLYLDFFPREGKRQGAWMNNYRPERIVNGKRSAPFVTLVFNFTPPSNDSPALLTYNEVKTFLHEFGHGLHGMLTECKYTSLSGTKVYWDFVELPSQIMENWAEQKEWLSMVARHYKTGEVIPDEILKNIIDAKNFQVAYGTLRQLSLGLTDMAYHTVKTEFSGNVYDFENNATQQVDLMEPIEGTNTSTSFNHIFAGGYASGYYSYKWAEVLDADAFSVFKEKGIFNKEVAASFRENILEKGGSQHPMILYKNYKGSEPSIKPLLERSGLN